MLFRSGRILMVGLVVAVGMESCTPFRIYPTNTSMSTQRAVVEIENGVPDFSVLHSENVTVDFGVQKFDTLTPTLRWSPFKLYEGVFDRTQKAIKNLHYRLVVYQMKTLADLRFTRYLRQLEVRKVFDFVRYDFNPEPGMWFVEEKNLTETSYTFSKPLEPNSTYVWAVTADYEDGDTHYENSAWIYLSDGESNKFLYSFDTP